MHGGRFAETQIEIFSVIVALMLSLASGKLEAKSVCECATCVGLYTGKSSTGGMRPWAIN